MKKKINHYNFIIYMKMINLKIKKKKFLFIYYNINFLQGYI